MSIDGSMWGAIVAWIGVVASCVFSWRAHAASKAANAASKEANEIQKQLLDIQADAHRRNLQQLREPSWRFAMERTLKAQHIVTVTNDGPGDAEAVRVFVNGHAIRQAAKEPGGPLGEYEVSLLPAKTAAHFSVPTPVYRALGAVPADVVVKWHNADGQEEERKTEVIPTR